MGRTTAGMSYSNGRARFPSKLKVIHLRGLTQRRCCCKPNLHASALILCVWFIHPNSANSCRPGATRWLHSNSALSEAALLHKVHSTDLNMTVGTRRVLVLEHLRIWFVILDLEISPYSTSLQEGPRTNNEVRLT